MVRIDCFPILFICCWLKSTFWPICLLYCIYTLEIGFSVVSSPFLFSFIYGQKLHMMTTYRAINCKWNAQTLCHMAPICFGKVRKWFLIRKILTVFAYMSFIIIRYMRTRIASAVLNTKNTEKSVIFTCFIELFAFILLPFLNALS